MRHPEFYFSGEKFVGHVVNCYCSMKRRWQMSLQLFYLNIPSQSCQNIAFSSDPPVFKCYENGTSSFFGNIGKQFDLNITSLRPEGDEVLYFRLQGGNVFINCTGCHVTKDVKSTTQSTTVGIMIQNNTLTTAHYQPHQAMASQSLSDAYAMFGGILAVIVIINILAVGIYCYIRNKRKQNKHPTSHNEQESVSPGGSNYTYIDTEDIKPNVKEVTRNGPDGLQNCTADSNKPAETSKNDYLILEPQVNDDDSVLPTNQYFRLECDQDRPENSQNLNGETNDNYDHFDNSTTETTVNPVAENTYNHIGGQDVTPNGTYDHIKPDLDVPRTITDDNFNNVDKEIDLVKQPPPKNKIHNKKAKVLKPKIEQREADETKKDYVNMAYDSDPVVVQIRKTDYEDPYNHLE